MIIFQRSSAYQVFVPMSMSMDCLLANSSEQRDEIAFVTRQYALFLAAWLLYVAKGKTHLPNMRVLVTVMILSCVFSQSWEGKQILHNDGVCSSTWMVQWWWWVGWPVLAMILAYIERHTGDRGGTAAETEALV
jgi:cytochrome bd-type quinol oxidase subunit 2